MVKNLANCHEFTKPEPGKNDTSLKLGPECEVYLECSHPEAGCFRASKLGEGEDFPQLQEVHLHFQAPHEKVVR